MCYDRMYLRRSETKQAHKTEPQRQEVKKAPPQPKVEEPTARIKEPA